MKKMDFNERKLCQIQGKLFEESIDKTNCSSLIFIRRFMNSNLANKFDDYSVLVMSMDLNDCFNEIEEEYGLSNYGKIKYTKEEMFWIGYIYRALTINYKLSSRKIFSLFNANKIINYYDIYHTFDIDKATEKMMESIDYNPPELEKEAYKLLKKLMVREKLEKMIGSMVKFCVSGKIVSFNSKYNDVFYGCIKEVAINDKYREAYFIGAEDDKNVFVGKVYALIENDVSDKLVIVPKNKEYTIEEIKEAVKFKEKNAKYKIVK